MSLTRRNFLTGATALSVGQIPLAAPASITPIHHYQLESAPGQQLLDSTLPAPTALWQYNQQVPGPLIRARQGDRLNVRYTNSITQDSAIHWHGIRIDNAMDGVVGLTQQAVVPGSGFEYSFVLPDAGTYWYHAHQQSSEQVGRGMYGVLIVDELIPPLVDQDIVIALDDWRLDQQGAIHESFNSMRDISHSGRTGNWLTVNGKGSETITVGAGQRIRLRLVNTANALVMQLSLPQWPNWLMALDGMPLKQPLSGLGRLELGPGQRADIILDCLTPGDPEQIIGFEEQSSIIPLVGFSPDQGLEKPRPNQSPVAFPQNMSMTQSTESVNRVDLVMQGGARGDLEQATYQGELMDIGKLVSHGKAWAFNGTSGLPDAPLLRATQGSVQEIVIENRSAWSHAMHLHGHHFEVVENVAPWLPQSADIPPLRVLRDTTLIGPHETRSIRFRADNIGKWLLHCHMLEHQAGGMVTWVEVI